MLTWSPSAWAACRKLSLNRGLGKGGAPLWCLYSLRDHDLALLVIQCLKMVVSKLCCIFYGGKSELVPVTLLKLNPEAKRF